MLNEYVVYLLEREDGLLYVGSTSKGRYSVRMSEHKSHKRMKGLKFTHKILEEYTEYDECIKGEALYIDKYNTYLNGLNMTVDGTGHNHSLGFTTKGYVHTEETKGKISNATKGRTPWNKGVKGCFSKETISKMSKKRKGVIHASKLNPTSVRDILTAYHERTYIEGVGKVQGNGKKLTYERGFAKKYSKMYDVTTSNIMKIIEGRSWSHVQKEFKI